MLNGNFNFDNLIRVRLRTDEGRVREELTRLGIGNSKESILYQTCHLIDIEDKFYIIHYKETFGLLGGDIRWVEGDIARRNKIARMIQSWGRIEILNDDDIDNSYDAGLDSDDIKVYKIRKLEKIKYDMRVMVDIGRLYAEEGNNVNQI